MTVHHPRTYDNSKSLEAHLLDAHGVGMATREGLVELIELHDRLHSTNPPETAQGSVIEMRYPHVHVDRLGVPTTEGVKGGDLQVGDHVLIECEVIQIKGPFGNHAYAVPIKGSYWNLGDQTIWTWAGEHGAGVGTPPNIQRVIR